MKLLAFDLATVTGVAVGDARASGPNCFTENLGSAGESHGARFAQAARMTKRLIQTHKPDHIAIEQPIASGAKGSASRVAMAMGLRAAVFLTAHMMHVPVSEHSVLTVRSHFIGHGRLPRKQAKEAVIRRCCRLGWPVGNDNEADAAAVWEYVRAHHRIASVAPMGGLFDAIG